MGTPRDSIASVQPEPAGHLKFQVHNNLKAAMEVNVGADWKVLYPFNCLELEAAVMDDVEVRLRDAPEIWGSCHVAPGALLWTSEAFGDFGPTARKFIEQEQKAADRERRCHQQRFQKILKKVKDAQNNNGVGSLIFMFVPFVGLVILAGVQPGNYVVAVLLSFVAATLLCCVCFFGMMKLWSQTWDVAAFQEARRLGTVHHVQSYVAVFLPCVCPVLAVACIIVMTVLYSINGFPLVALILWISCWCCSACFGVSQYNEEGIRLDDAKNMIIFEGKVLGSQPCVCSWPGKYETAWDVLVESSHQGNLSAAVVFLPEGSTEYGHHDLRYADDQDEGCWCRVLYGEPKPWGCRWWTHWIANIEEAVKQGAELEVYFFERKKGQGKVQSFETAGKEHMRREAINSRKKEFEDSVLFKNAKDAGLRELVKDKVADGSSQYSREYQRLFLSWLPEEDGKFLEASEGLGNSQKAEVAWLEKKGYAYTSVEIDVAKWLRDSNGSHSECLHEVIGLPAV